MKALNNNTIKRIVDVLMTAVLLLLTAFQITGNAVHEWLGISMTALVIIHQVLNRKWYCAMFRGKYNPLRIFQSCINILLLLSFVFTALCGMSMSGHAVPFMYGIIDVAFARGMHLAMSFWTFALMGIHLGAHLPLMTAKLGGKNKKILFCIFVIAALAGLFFLIRNGIFGYMFFVTRFALFDFKKAAISVISENILMLLFWAFIGNSAVIILKILQKNKNKEK